MNTTPYSWVVNHLSAVGWPALIFTCYRLVIFIIRATRSFTFIEQRVLKAEETIYLMASNHLVHLQQSMDESNRHLAEISATLKLNKARDDA